MKPFLNTRDRKSMIYELSEHDISKQIAPLMWKYPGLKKGMTVTVLEGVHGNETSLEIVKEILQLAKQFEVQIGNLIVGIGNPGAFINGTRGTKKGQDLNREFGDNQGNSYEKKRAQSLKPILGETDLLIDIHKTIKPSTPMVIAPKINDQVHELVKIFGIPLVISGQGLYQPDGEAINTDTFVTKNGGIGMTIESGYILDPEADKISKKIKAALVELGIFPADILEGKSEPTENFTPEIYDAYWNVVAGLNFKFTKNWQNFEKIAAGEVFAVNDSVQLFPESDSKILFPKSNDNIVSGHQACLMLK